ncbi:hypothetical protein ACIBO5_12895 [Nonomuraea angiospora]|uniref:hypothetical protein n=1 Tax=Nonomuraea angiospora TaxID=46172 RepID=UPI0037B9FEA3
MHGELTTLGLKVAPSTVWEILKQEGIDPAPERASTTWADFLRSQADALLACDFVETVTLNGQRHYILAVIEHATRRIRVLGTTALCRVKTSHGGFELWFDEVYSCRQDRVLCWSACST